MRSRVFASLVLGYGALLFPPKARAWNDLAQRVVAEIAWQELDEATREKIVAVLRQVPLIMDSVAKETDSDSHVDDRSVYLRLVAMSSEGGEPPDEWRFIRFPVFLGPARPVEFDLVFGPSGLSYSAPIYRERLPFQSSF